MPSGQLIYDEQLKHEPIAVMNQYGIQVFSQYSVARIQQCLKLLNADTSIEFSGEHHLNNRRRLPCSIWITGLKTPILATSYHSWSRSHPPILRYSLTSYISTFSNITICRPRFLKPTCYSAAAR